MYGPVSQSSQLGQYGPLAKLQNEAQFETHLDNLSVDDRPNWRKKIIFKINYPE